MVVDRLIGRILHVWVEAREIPCHGLSAKKGHGPESHVEFDHESRHSSEEHELSTKFKLLTSNNTSYKPAWTRPRWPHVDLSVVKSLETEQGNTYHDGPLEVENMDSTITPAQYSSRRE